MPERNAGAGPRAIVRKDLLTAILEGGKRTDRVEIRRIDFAPGQATGRHLHPGPVVGYIARGRILFQIEGEAAKELSAGDAFFEPARKTIMHFDNASSADPATFIAFYLLGEDEHELITMLE